MRSSLHRVSARIGRWPRVCAAGICVLLAIASALQAAHGRPVARAQRTEAVVVASRTLPAGHLLTRRDLRVGRWPPDLSPPGAAATSRGFVGRRLAGPLLAREPVTSARLVGADLTAGLPGDTAATPVVVDDPHAADLVHPGNYVDLVATPRSSDFDMPAPARSPPANVIGTHLLALAVLRGTDAGGVEVVVAADQATTMRIARYRTTQAFTAVVVSP